MLSDRRVLHLLVQKGQSVSDLLKTLPRYTIVKEKLPCPSDKLAAVLRMLKQEYAAYRLDTRDGVKVMLPNGWFLVRGSNTEPVIRVVAELRTEREANEIIAAVRAKVEHCIKNDPRNNTKIHEQKI